MRSLRGTSAQRNALALRRKNAPRYKHKKMQAGFDVITSIGNSSKQRRNQRRAPSVEARVGSGLSACPVRESPIVHGETRPTLLRTKKRIAQRASSDQWRGGHPKPSLRKLRSTMRLRAFGDRPLQMRLNVKAIRAGVAAGRRLSGKHVLRARRSSSRHGTRSGSRRRSKSHTRLPSRALGALRIPVRPKLERLQAKNTKYGIGKTQQRYLRHMHGTVRKTPKKRARRLVDGRKPTQVNARRIRPIIERVRLACMDRSRTPNGKPSLSNSTTVACVAASV